MSLWGNRDFANNAPLFPPVGGLGVTANGNVMFQNTQVSGFVTGIAVGVEGVTPTEKGNTALAEANSQHAGWNIIKKGTGPVVNVNITSGGRYNANGSLVFSGGNGSGAVATFNIGYANTVLTGVVNTTNGSVVVTGTNTIFVVEIVANIDFITVGSQTLKVANVTSNTNLQVQSAFTANAVFNTATRTTNTIIFTTVVAGGSLYTDPPTAVANAANTTAATFQVVTGGRSNRVQAETLVAMGSMT